MSRPSRLGRFARIGELGTRLTSGWVGQKLRTAFADESVRAEAADAYQLDSAMRVVETLGRLKGVAMKVGQSLSVAAQHLDLPDEVRERLSRLQSQATPVPFKTVKATIESELGAPLGELFQQVREEPLGTASLGQAHLARLPSGEEVVVKVLHPGVDDAVDADLLALRAVIYSSVALGRHRMEVEAVYQEVRTRLLEELDYLQEAANLHAFRKAFAADHPGVRVPALYPSWCSERVVVLDFLPGKPFASFLDEADVATKQQAGVNLAHLFLEQVFRHRILHADPHPGNYLIEADGRIDLLDFGCVKRFDPWWIASYARAVLAALDGDEDALIAACQAMEALPSEVSAEARQVVCDFCETVVAPWREPSHTIGGSEDTVVARLQPVVRRLWACSQVRTPRDIVFLHRTLGGLYSMAAQLEVTANWDAMVRPYLLEAIATAEA